MSIYVLGFYALLSITVLAAICWGGWAERSVAALFTAATIATVGVRTPWAIRYSAVEMGVLIVDLLLLASLALVVMRSQRMWPIFATAFHAVALLAHLAKAVNPDFWRFGYDLMAGMGGYPAVVALAIGVLRNRRSCGRPAKMSSNGSFDARDGPRDR